MPKPDHFNKKPRYFNALKFNEEDAKGPKLGFLPENVMSYYRQVSTSLDDGFDDDDPTVKGDFLDNVYVALKDEGIQVAQNQTVSRILEVLFTHSSPKHLRGLFTQFSKELSIVTFDRFASHVFQALVQYLPGMYDDKADEEETTKLKSTIDQLCQFTESHMRDFMTHTYGSHVLRSLLEVLSGVPVKAEVISSRMSRKQNVEKTLATSKDLSKDYNNWFVTIKDKIIRLCNYEDHLSDNNYCPVLQTVLLILHKISPSEYTDLASTIITKTCPQIIVTDANVNDVTKRLPLFVQDEVGSHLMELLISLASESQLKELYNDVFKDKVIYFAVHPYANYVLQKLLTFTTEKEMFFELLDEVTKYVEDILAANHIGIVTKLVEASKKNHLGQDKVIQALMSAFHCETPKEKQQKFFPLIASMQTHEIMFDSKEGEEKKPGLLKSIIIHGSLILQQLVHFDNTKIVALSMLELSPAELSFVCCDKSGSHIVDAFFQSQSIKEKNKEDFLKKLQGLYINIACNRNGSRCLENIWKESSLKRKTFIAEQLIKGQERIESDQWGHFLYRNFALFKFSQRRREWIDFQNGIFKKKQMLQNILEGDVDKKKKRKKKNQQSQAQDKSQDVTSSTNTEEVETTPLESPNQSKNGKTDQTVENSEEVDHANISSKKKKKKKKKKGLAEGEETGIVEELIQDDVNVRENGRHSQKRKASQLVESSEEVDTKISTKKKKKSKKDDTQDDTETGTTEETIQSETDAKSKDKKRKRKKNKRNILRGGNDGDSDGS